MSDGNLEPISSHPPSLHPSGQPAVAASAFEWAFNADDFVKSKVGFLVLPDGTVHHGEFENGRASGQGIVYSAIGTVTSGCWIANKRVGVFMTIDPKGGVWEDTYEDGKRISRKKRAPPPPNAPGALRCKHCGVKFHSAYNSQCRQHAGKWLQASEIADGSGERSGVDQSALPEDAGLFPDGGIWLCCGSKSRIGGETCSVGVHATDASGAQEVMQLSRNADGEVVILEQAQEERATRSERGECRTVSTQLEADWRERARHCVLHEAPFVSKDGQVWLNVDSHEILKPLASLAECGLTACACTRSLYPTVRKDFREAVVCRALAAREAGTLSADGRLSYTSLGSGRLLGDLDVICGLQEAGFTIETAAFIDIDYQKNENGRAALAELTNYLAPEGKVTAFGSCDEYAAARREGRQPAAHIFVQIDADEIPVEASAALSDQALVADHGLGFRLRNQFGHLPMDTWCSLCDES